ncbi:MAG TPA: hypothetical protein DIU00_21510 [Phycisphaerales bacterium]|nr:hypothetical protein [Phycisphaerales bacterium]
MTDVTRILNAIEQGDERAADRLLPLVYEELRRLAAHKMSHEPPGQNMTAKPKNRPIGQALSKKASKFD